MERSAPAWMVGLIVLFSISLAVTFAMTIYFHGEAASAREQWNNAQREVVFLRQRASSLDRQSRTLAEPIELRRAKIADIREGNRDEEMAVRDTLLPNHFTAVAEIAEAIERFEATRTTLLANARRAQGDLQQEKNNSLAAAIQADEDRRRLRDQVREQSRALEQIKKENREQLLEMDGEIAQRQERVQELLDRIDTTTRDLTSDGQLLRAHATSGFVIINRGRAHQLLKGTRFVVYNRRGGQNIIKGEIEVHEVQGNIAVCRVLSEHDPNDPLIPGDHIYNRIYRPDEVKNFVIVGDFERYNDREIAQFVRDGGGAVDDELSTRTHYLVAGDGPEAARALEEASLLGVTVLSEDQAIDLVRQPMQFRVRQGMTFALVGDFDQVDATSIRNFIRDNGGVIQNRVRDGLHVLVAGSNAADAIAEARMVGARIVTQGELGHLIGRPRDQGR
ncbi:MAG: hypothetical protein EA402_02440 [Planctomycetota bacterium]|nr:MAG: hypothetical protein EA402_02440 [Planctomycetota bacterium]